MLKNIQLYVASPLIIVLVCFLLIQRLSAAPMRLYLAPALGSSTEAYAAYKQEKPIILWDIHEVLFEPHLGHGIWKAAHNAPNKALIVKEFFKNIAHIKTWRHWYKQALQRTRVKQAYFEIFSNSPKLYQQFITFSNDVYKPNKTMFEIVEKLHQLGYQQYLFSNIGPDVLDDLIQCYPTLFALFTSSSNLINSTKPANDHWICKPHKEAYEYVLTKLNTAPERLIFIDDNRSNVKAAQKAGMTSIWARSAPKVRKELTLLGLI